MFKKGFRREDGASRTRNSKRVSDEPASDSMNDETYSSMDYNVHLGSKVHYVDNLSHSTPRSETSYEAKNVRLQNDNSSYNGCEIESIHSSGLARGNAEVGTLKRIHNEAFPSRFPAFHASEQGPWFAMISYEACVRLCLHSWETDEAAYFLNNGCILMRKAFGISSLNLRKNYLKIDLLSWLPKRLNSRQVLEKLNFKFTVGRIKMGSDPPLGCNIKPEIVSQQIAELNGTLSSGWKAVKRIHIAPRVPLNGSLSRKSLAYLRACARYLKQFSCSLRLKSSAETDQIKTQPESGETFVFLPDSIGDDLIVEVRDSKGQFCGRVLAQLAAIVDEPNEKIKWWAIYHEPEHERIGRIQLHINYSSRLDEKTKCGLVAETSAYDLVLEVAMKAEQFQRQKLLIKGPWHWMVTQFASYYGISDVYTKLRYLSYVMDVASPTKDCLELIYDFLYPVIMKENYKAILSHQENRLLKEIDEQVQQILASTFENYKSLDESFFSGTKYVFEPPSSTPAPAIAAAIKLYGLLNDVLSPEAQLRLCRYFQAASKKRSIRYLSETNDILHNGIEGGAQVNSNQKMKSLILSLKNEISTDIAIHNCNVLPSFIDLPNLSAAIYSMDLFNRLREYLTAWPPTSPLPSVVDLVITTSDFEADLSSWNLNPITSGVNAKEIFHPYITNWIEEIRNALYELCKTESAKAYSEIQGLTSPVVDDMYVLLNATLDDFDIIIRRWPEYAASLEKVIADAEKAIIEELEKQISEFLSPLKENKISALKYVQRLTMIGTSYLYTVPKELGVLLNSMKKVIDDESRSSIQNRFRVWNAYFPNKENKVLGERLNDVTVLLRSKFRSYTQALMDKLAENMRIQNHMRIKNIIHDLRETTS